MARNFVGMVLVLLSMWAVDARRPNSRLDFFNFSGLDSTVTCMDQPAKTLVTGETFSFPLTHSNQACTVKLQDGKYVSAVVGQVLPGSSDSGSSVSVDITDTFLFFALDETNDHQYVSYVNSQGESPDSWSDLMLWAT